MAEGTAGGTAAETGATAAAGAEAGATVPKPVDHQAALDLAAELAKVAERLTNRLLQPWSGYQLLIIGGILLFSYLLHRMLQPKLRTFLGQPRGWPKWVMRILAVIHRRLFLLILVAVAWSVVFVMRETTWPSRSYLVTLAAELATWYLVIAVVTRLIRSQPMRAVARWGGWIYATLTIFGIRDDVAAFLDSLAITIGELRISALTVVTAAVSLFILFALANMLARASASRINRIEDISPSIRVLLVKGLQVLLFGIAFVIALRIVGFDVSNLALLSGALAFGIGFGLQKIVSNLVSGVIILLDRSIKPGDVISLGDTFGWVSELGARYTSVTTRDGREYLVPNEDFITMQVVNWSHSSDLIRLDVTFGISYDADPHVARKLAVEAAGRVARVLDTPRPVCHLTGFGASSVDFVLRFWIRDAAAGLTNVRGEVYLAVWDILKENDIEIPFAQMDLHIKPDSRLRIEGGAEGARAPSDNVKD